ncbi:MAG: acyl-CoA desaturase [Balneolales bacterium]|nr:acyl-CoA desaturase [Balneolales bacterium]
MPSLVTFNNKIDKEFSKAVKARVDQYFKDSNISKHANAAMIFKTVAILSIFLIPFLLIMLGNLPLTVMWLLCFVMGIGFAGIGFSITHDALHGAYSSNNTVNNILGTIFDLVGANGYIWKITHNIIHHTYTNIHGHDEDLEVAEFIRLSPHTEYKPIHKYQRFLAFPAYSFATLFWVFIKDYWYFFKSPLGPYENKKHPTNEWVKLIITKLFNYGVFIVWPLLALDITIGQFLIGFVTMHLTAGLILGIVFQLAHVVENTTHPIPNEDNMIENHWVIHEMLTTNNFARKNRLLCWYVGGLNFQIEHHLFPKVCSIHYPKISPIVEQTAKEFGVPYNCHETFLEAIGSHYRTLKKFGDKDFTWAPATA